MVEDNESPLVAVMRSQAEQAPLADDSRSVAMNELSKEELDEFTREYREVTARQQALKAATNEDDNGGDSKAEQRTIDGGIEHKLFVYGTLKTNQHNNRVLQGSISKGYGYLHGYRMIHLGGFPAIFRTPWHPESRIFGEIFLVSNEVLARCDQLEGVPLLYTRQRAHIDHYGEVWLYEQMEPKSDYKAILGGVWSGPDTMTTPCPKGDRVCRTPGTYPLQHFGPHWKPKESILPALPAPKKEDEGGVDPSFKKWGYPKQAEKEGFIKIEWKDSDDLRSL